jgi:hypothetical protein
MLLPGTQESMSVPNETRSSPVVALLLMTPTYCLTPPVKLALRAARP